MVRRMTNAFSTTDVQVESSSLQTVGYASETRSLQITFRNGRRYRYFEVPDEVHQELLRAESKGRYFNAAIKPAFVCERLP